MDDDGGQVHLQTIKLELSKRLLSSHIKSSNETKTTTATTMTFLKQGTAQIICSLGLLLGGAQRREQKKEENERTNEQKEKAHHLLANSNSIERAVLKFNSLVHFNQSWACCVCVCAVCVVQLSGQSPNQFKFSSIGRS